MKELILGELGLVSGANGPSNAQVLKDIAIDAGLGAATTPLTPWVGAGYGAAASVIHGAINNGPVNVPVPVLVNPSFSGAPSWAGMIDFCLSKGLSANCNGQF